MTHIIGLWCGGAVVKNVIRKIHEMPCLRLVSKRIDIGPQIALIPWDTSLDWLEAEAKAMHLNVVRCAQDERLAMRDMVADRNPDYGLLIHGDCVDIDEAEVRLAIARLRSCQWERYESHRIKGYPMATWLQCSDSDQWGPREGFEEFARERMASQILEDTRRFKARSGHQRVTDSTEAGSSARTPQE